MDERYKARCLRHLKEWGAPLSGWTCVRVDDTGDYDEEPDSECELCGCKHVRYLHVMDHPLYFEPISVGCICAGIMEGDELAAIERDRKMKNRSKRRDAFLQHTWNHRRDTWYRTYHGKRIRIWLTGGKYVVYVDKQYISRYKGKIITDFLSAVYAAFNLADPIEEVWNA